MKLLDGSGGSTKGIGIYSCWKTLVELKGYKPDLISAVSVSSIIAVPFVLRKYEFLESIFRNLELDTIFSIKPIDEKNRPTFNAILRFITGKESLGEMGNLVRMLKRIVNKNDFEEYKRGVNKGIYPKIYVCCVDYKSGARIIPDISTLDYESFINYTIASASIPIATPSIKINDYYLFDGGVRDHSIGAYMMEHFNLTEVVSVFSRPKDFNISNDKWKPNNVINVAFRTSDIQNMELSKSDEREQILLSKLKNIKLTQLFLPNVGASLYETDRKKLKELELAGMKEAMRYE